MSTWLLAPRSRRLLSFSSGACNKRRCFPMLSLESHQSRRILQRHAGLYHTVRTSCSSSLKWTMCWDDSNWLEWRCGSIRLLFSSLFGCSISIPRIAWVESCDGCSFTRLISSTLFDPYGYRPTCTEDEDFRRLLTSICSESPRLFLYNSFGWAHPHILLIIQPAKRAKWLLSLARFPCTYQPKSEGSSSVSHKVLSRGCLYSC